MDEHQRRVLSRMIDQLDAYERGEVGLGQLVDDLRGLVAASDIHDQAVIDEFWDHFAPIDGELELRSEPWAPAGSASDDDLRQSLARFRRWATSVLATNGTERR